MTPDEIEQELMRSIAFAISQHGYQPPRNPDPDKRQPYYLSVARGVVQQLKYTWSFEEPGILRRKPPLTPHDCHPPRPT